MSRSRTALVRKGDGPVVARVGQGYSGLKQTLLIGDEQGSVHQQVVISELAAGGTIPGHFHAFEESFLILEGEVLFSVGGASYRLVEGDYGFAPIGAPHAWNNISSRPARWLQIRAPQPKAIAKANGVYAYPDLLPPVAGKDVVLGHPLSRHVGHFDLDQMPPYGPISTRGITSYLTKHLSVRLIVDDTLGAMQHVVFIAQLPPGPKSSDKPRDIMEADHVAKSHFHQYEEVYHFLQGKGLAFLEGKTYEVFPGDTILAGVGSSHAVISIGDEPLRWLETQAPRPPERDAMFWERDWAACEAIDVRSE